MKQDILTVRESGNRLDKYLAENLDDISRSQLKKLIINGDILINDECKSPSYILNRGDKIIINFVSRNTVDNYINPQNIPLDIIFEDEDIIVINKPCGLTVHPGVGNRDGTLANGLAYHFKDLSNINGPLRPGIVHRLDRDTSGIILVAKNNKSHMKLAEQFSSRKVKKMYYGITWGKWNQKRELIDRPISRKRTDPTTFQVQTDGKISQTEFEVLQETEYFSFMNISPRTGRTHQIRVHAAYKGHPIIGDNKYGGGKSKIKGYLPEICKKLTELFKLVPHHILHAQKISFIHPSTNLLVSFETGLPTNVKEIQEKIHSLNV